MCRLATGLLASRPETVPRGESLARRLRGHRVVRAVRATRGHYRYFGLPSNWHALDGFYDEVCRGWFRALRRRSQRGLTWDRFNQWLARFPLPRARIIHTREALAG